MFLVLTKAHGRERRMGLEEKAPDLLMYAPAEPYSPRIERSKAPKCGNVLPVEATPICFLDVISEPRVGRCLPCAAFVSAGR
jgi:hypothetical protein